MEKRTSNTFVGGMVTDRHPLSSQNTELIDAQNIDLIQVGEGYQLILQKREGNLEVLVTPGQWSSLMPYARGEYVTYESIIYRSQSASLNDIPSSNPETWEVINLTLVSAGLTEGFIPLAVKEFNNLAYIISVNPDTSEGEIGTFPSPDYNQFIYEKGDVELATPTIGAGVADLRIRYDYEYSITGILNSGNDETINSSSFSYQLTKAGFTIKNEGLQIDTYYLTTTESGGVYMLVNGGLYNPATDIVTLGPGASAIVTFKHISPFTKYLDTTYYPPNILYNSTVTITSESGEAVLSPQTYNYKYHIAPMMAVRYAGDTDYIVTPSFPVTLPVAVIPLTGGYTQFQWITNDGTLTGYDPNNFTTMPTRPGDIRVVGATYIELTMGNNTIVPPPIRVGAYTLMGNYPAKGSYSSGTVSCVLNVEQTNI